LSQHGIRPERGWRPFFAGPPKCLIFKELLTRSKKGSKPGHAGP
jgi:hypothetical protein